MSQYKPTPTSLDEDRQDAIDTFDPPELEVDEDQLELLYSPDDVEDWEDAFEDSLYIGSPFYHKELNFED